MSDTLARLASALADRYAIERELGAGGMATVYLAKDLKHDRDVAVKVLRPELAAALGPERFLREIKIAAQLQHPHILPLHDSGEVDGFLFYVMPYVKGESLRERLTQHGELPIAEAVKVMREVVDALAYAHEQGVVHRDIKPDNIMLSGRHALVVDFGVAKAVSEATGRQALTTAGVALGTPAYMAPEQATADPTMDHRADIYAVGAVGYELLAGRPPFTGNTPQMILAAHVTQAVEPVTKHRDSVPPALNDLILRCLQKKPADRWQSADEMLPELEALATTSGGITPTATRPLAGVQPARVNNKVVGIAAAAVVLVAAGMWFTGRGSSPAAVPPVAAEDSVPSIAVLAFADRSPQGDNEYFADGMSEAIMAGLAQVGMRVAARTSSFSFKGLDASVQTIGEQLDVTYVLEGSVQKAGDRIRVQASLISASDGFPVWTQTYNNDLDDIFAVQDQVVSAIVEELQVELGAAVAASVVDVLTDSPEAYQSYMLGRFNLEKRTAEAMVTAISHFEDAVRADSNFALAWSGLATAQNLTTPANYPVEGVSWEGAVERAERAARRAIATDSALAEAHASLGYILDNKWDWAGAEVEYERALALNPDYPTARLWYAIHLVQLGRTDEALVEIRRAEALDPLSLIIGAWVANILETGGNVDGAERRVEELAAQYPNSFRAQIQATEFYLRTRQFPQASVHMRRLAEITGDDSWAQRAEGIANAESRDETLRQWADSTEDIHVHIALGDTEGALRALEERTQGEWLYARLAPYLSGARLEAILRERGLRD
ncbi:MAG: protein kinase [Gemmatimonadetes bacterium]|nr:protein kinase [Gemmatimonadota bacterium]